MKKKNKKSGFIALISVILVSAILLLIAVTLSVSNFFERYAILDSEFKERSVTNAEACAREGLLLIANNTVNLSTTTITISSGNTCKLGPIQSSGDPRIFYVQSNVFNFYTNLKISVHPNDLSIVSWEEIATY